MWKTFTPVLLTAGLLVLSCDQLEDKPQLLESLAHSQWEVTGYLPPGTPEPKVSPVPYQLTFINDSTFILQLDINRLVGKYSATQGGGFSVREIKRTDNCCDSEYALQMAEIVQSANVFQSTKEGIALQGSGEVFLKKKITENP
ncbi:MAG TPA: hypothetical protein VK957_15940 [Lunatimonas sp.]|nr:hypothetical protein [Lunatimonas sp.]